MKFFLAVSTRTKQIRFQRFYSSFDIEAKQEFVVELIEKFDGNLEQHFVEYYNNNTLVFKRMGSLLMVVGLDPLVENEYMILDFLSNFMKLLENKFEKVSEKHFCHYLVEISAMLDEVVIDGMIFENLENAL